MPEFTCLELFAGCGGMGYGFHQHGFRIVCANELEASIAETYKHNFPDTNVIVGDIVSDSIKDSICESFRDIECDVIIGGPPCVAYSMAGHRNSRDPRGQLFNDYVEIVRRIRPKMFVMENVKGILTILHDKPVLTDEERRLADEYYALEDTKLKLQALKKTLVSTKKTDSEEYRTVVAELKENTTRFRHAEKDIHRFRVNVTDIIKQRLSELGYIVDMKLLNSANFGVPQRRERVIFIGVRNDLRTLPVFPEETHGDSTTTPWVTVRQAIDDLKNIRESVPAIQHIITKHSDDFTEKIHKTPVGKSVNPKYTEAFYRCHPDEPSTTVKENHGGVFVHYELDRVMTPRELARLQSFPDDFIFKGTKSNILVQIGNAVPCRLSSAIAETVKKTLTDSN